MQKSDSKIADELIETGKALLLHKLDKSALALFRKAFAFAPDHLEAGLYLADAIHRSGEIEEALNLYRTLLLKFNPSLPLLHNYGVSLLHAGNYAEAEDAFRKALDIDPFHADSLVPLSTAVMRQGCYYDALKICEKVISIECENAEAHWNRSLILLTEGILSEGFIEYEWRWKKKSFTSPARHDDTPLWNKEIRANCTVLVHAEQGFGDTIQFCRYLLLLEKICAKVIFECHPELLNLLSTLSDKIEVIPFGCSLPSFDFQIPLMSLPNHFTLDMKSIPCETPYIKSLGKALGSPDIKPKRFSAGICWQGKSYPDADRSCSYENLSPLLSLKNINWYSLNVSNPPPLDSSLIDTQCMISDFSDTAAIVESLDFVVSIDSAVAHLAGAMGKPVYLLLQKYSDWRWFLDRSDSPWYPSMRIIRQKRAGIWDEALMECREEIKMYLNKSPKT